MKDKEYVRKDYMEMITKSWTYDRMTSDERKKLGNLFISPQLKNALKGTYKQRWDVLNAMYHSFLIGIGYTDYSWRDENV